MKKVHSLIAAFVLLFVFSVGAIYAQDDMSIADVVTTAAEADEAEFTILLQLLDELELLETLADAEAEFTVFAPTDAAFEALFEELEIEAQDLIDIPDFTTQALLYHVLEEIILSEDLEDEMALETLSGDSILVTVNDEDEDAIEVLLNENTTVIATDIEASNGIVHVIDAVLLPTAGEACTVSTSQARYTRVRVGPGENRTSVTFMPENIDIEVLGRTENDDGSVWYQVDKEAAASGRSINEAWVADSEVETTGNCSNVADAAAPPIIPIINRPPPAPPSDSGGDDSSEDSSDSGETDSGGETAPAAVGSLPNSGSWTFYYNEFTNASCEGTGNVPIPTADIVGAGGMTDSISVVRTSASSFNFYGTAMEHIGNGVYYGSVSEIIQGQTVYGTIYIDSVVTANQVVGRVIFSFDDCTATLGFVANHN